MKVTRPLRLVLALACVAAGVRLVRSWYLRWGATDEEVARAMPMDDHVMERRTLLEIRKRAETMPAL